MPLTPPTLQDHAAETISNLPAGGLVSPRGRLFALGLVLFVSFGQSISASTYVLAGTPTSADPRQFQARLLGALISEAGSLAVLWYVLSSQGRSWKNIGWSFEWLDIPRSFSLVFGSGIASYLIYIPVQLVYRSYSGHYLIPKSMHGIFGFGISAFSIAFICLNPFFEELIVRGFLMSEIFALGGNAVIAVLISIAMQMSYHLYQGFTNGIVLTTTFAVFAIYFCKTRRIAPVVLAHLCIDVYALLKGSF
jgi:membrane protease YdiL (CAAX protease family)